GRVPKENWWRVVHSPDRAGSALDLSRAMRSEEGTDLAHRQGDSLLGLLPRVDAYFRLRREHCALHRHGVRMRWDIVRHYEHGCRAVGHEIARKGEDEIGVGAEHPGQEFFDRTHGDFGRVLAQFRPPARHAAIVHEGGHLRPDPDGLRWYARDNTIGRPP